jgi:hypothetical protein
VEISTTKIQLIIYVELVQRNATTVLTIRLRVLLVIVVTTYWSVITLVFKVCVQQDILFIIQHAKTVLLASIVLHVLIPYHVIVVPADFTIIWVIVFLIAQR